MKFLHLSDLHFHRHQADNQSTNRLLKVVKKKYPEHHLIITGDIVDDGHAKQYDTALKALKPFLGQVYVAPGNHDFGAVGNFYSRERAERFDRMLTEPLEQGGTFTGDNTPVVNIVDEEGTRVRLIALDTNLETDHPFDFASGEVGEEQLSALKAILSSEPNDYVNILFFHHHPFMHNNPFMELRDAKELFRAIYGRVDVLLFGHKHVSAIWENQNGIRWILASDNSPGKDWAREIVVKGITQKVNDVSLKAN